MFLCFKGFFCSRGCIASELNAEYLTNLDDLSKYLKKHRNFNQYSLQLTFLDKNFNFQHNSGYFENFEFIMKLILDGNKNIFPNKRIPILIGELKEFSCVDCGFDEVFELTFSRMPNILMLNLAHNRIHKVNKRAFNRNKNIKHISLSDNELIEVPEIAIQLEKFQYLDLSHNIHLSFLENKAILSQVALEYLYLNNCRISEIFNVTFSELPNITHINLNNNNITVIHEDAFSENMKLSFLSLMGNAVTEFSCESLLKIQNIINNSILQSNSMNCTYITASVAESTTHTSPYTPNSTFFKPMPYAVTITNNKPTSIIIGNAHENHLIYIIIVFEITLILFIFFILRKITM